MYVSCQRCYDFMS